MLHIFSDHKEPDELTFKVYVCFNKTSLSRFSVHVG